MRRLHSNWEVNHNKIDTICVGLIFSFRSMIPFDHLCLTFMKHLLTIHYNEV